MRTRTPPPSQARLLLAAAMLLVVTSCGRPAPEGEAAISPTTDPAAQSTTPQSVDPADDTAGAMTDGSMTEGTMADGSQAMDDGSSAMAEGTMAESTDNSQPPAVTPPIITSENNTAVVDQTPGLAGVRVVSDNPIVAPATPPTTTPSTQPDAMTNPGVHVVQPGDTLSVIAAQYQVPLEAIVEANGIDDVDSIRPGQELIIPAG